MRIAIVSDIHGNRTAFEAVLADLRKTSPDVILHGGDLADTGSSPAEIVDHVRDLGWPGVLGNGEEMLARPESLEGFARQSAAPPALWDAVREMAAATRAALGEERIAWMRGLPLVQTQGPVALVHAGPKDPWRAPAPTATDAELESVYAPLGAPIAVYGHIHRSFIRRFGSTGARGAAGETAAKLIVANSGSVSLSYDGDLRAAYLLLDGVNLEIRRVEYDRSRELQALAASGLPHADWVARTLETASPQMP